MNGKKGMTGLAGSVPLLLGIALMVVVPQQASALPQAETASVQALAADAVKAGLPAEDVQIIVERSAARGVNAAAVGRFFDAALAAKKTGAPAGPVLDRIDQGLSKGVPADRIAAAAERLGNQLVLAHPLVDSLVKSGLKAGRSSDRDEAVEATARALEKSVSRESLKALGEAVIARGGQMPLYTDAANTAAYCAANGMSPMTAAGMVRSAVARGYGRMDLDAMVKRINDEMKRGGRPEDIAAKMEHEGPGQGADRDAMHESMRPGPGMGGGMGGRGR